MAKAEFKIIGSSPARIGGVERVVGKGVYGIDLMLKDQLHGAILRSQYAHAKIVSIDTSEAKKDSRVHAVVTAEDAPTCATAAATSTAISSPRQSEVHG
jgi:CO/xanthine dehydrogenase Mo-binding subunit